MSQNSETGSGRTGAPPVPCGPSSVAVLRRVDDSPDGRKQAPKTNGVQPVAAVWRPPPSPKSTQKPNGIQPAKSIQGQKPQFLALSPRQTEIARLVAGGLTDKEIGNQLRLNEGTVGCHLKRIFLKWQVHSRAGLAARFVQETPPQPEPPVPPYHERGTSSNLQSAA